MPGYVKEALIKFQHFVTKQQFSASPYSKPTYGKKIQYITIDNVTFKPEQIKLLQKYVENSYIMRVLLITQCYIP